MIEFYTTALTFPTLLYSILLAFCVVYWLLAATGLVDSDTIHGLLHHHDGLDGMQTHHHHDAATDSAGILARLGLSGVPFMLILSVLAFFGWLITYFAQLLLLQFLPDPLRILAGIGVLVAALLPGLVLTSLLLRPVARLIMKLRPPVPPSILGKAGNVISPKVTDTEGRAEFDDGGAGLILQVRAPPGATFSRGERVVLLSFDDASHAYTVMSESEFLSR
ncbi:YqiJ family protein [Thermomonas sp. HDW16]|uniref:YqiJ family protein n=1 Tax=Thermomonas sp. HDW16 TaxID=2714945 RepID=UPI00140D4002|nr:YqiJ family protein [Thermomonas sp. HDW16]QIL19373.1 YqiJ family protein [Thermomonas sp. HDW16]